MNWFTGLLVLTLWKWFISFWRIVLKRRTTDLKIMFFGGRLSIPIHKVLYRPKRTIHHKVTEFWSFPIQNTVSMIWYVSLCQGTLDVSRHWPWAIHHWNGLSKTHRLANFKEEIYKKKTKQPLLAKIIIIEIIKTRASKLNCGKTMYQIIKIDFFYGKLS